MMCLLLVGMCMWPLPPGPTGEPVAPWPEVEPMVPEAEEPGVKAVVKKPVVGVVKPERSPVAYPSLLITEILYAVPGGDVGDANADGTRHATGDEFIELVNPHQRAINIGGYKLADNAGTKPGQLLIVFPEMRLGPGEVVVVFNGLESNIGGPVGDSTRGPRARNDNFHGAWVFSMKASSSRTSLANAGDYVLLLAASGEPMQVVHWGKLGQSLPKAGLVEEAPMTSGGSVERESIGGRFVPHDRHHDEPSSPGKFAAVMKVEAGGEESAKPVQTKGGQKPGRKGGG